MILNYLRTILIFLIVITPNQIYANGLEFPINNIPISSRVLGMGGAFTGQADDISSSFYNPAGFINIKDKEILAFKTKLQNETDLYLISFGIKRNNNAFSIGWIEANVSGIPIIEKNIASPTEDIHEDAFTNYQNHLFNIAYSRKITDKFSLGFNNILSFGRFNNLYSNSKFYSLSIGLQYKTKQYFNFGLYFKDIINNYKFDNSKSERTLSKLITGFNLKPISSLNINFDFSMPLNKTINSSNTCFGMEFCPKNFLDLRFGLYEKIPVFGISLKNSFANISYSYMVKSNDFMGINNFLSIKLIF